MSEAPPSHPAPFDTETQLASVQPAPVQLATAHPAATQSATAEPTTTRARRSRTRRVGQVTGFGALSVLALASAKVPATVIVPVMIVVLAGIDIIGGVVAKSWALGRGPWTFAAGIALFVLLFWVYGLSLRHGELSTITIGWVVLVTLADMGLDAFHYHVHFPLSKWLAALAAVALLAYLLTGNDSAVQHGAQATTCLDPPAGTGGPAVAVPAVAVDSSLRPNVGPEHSNRLAPAAAEACAD